MSPALRRLINVGAGASFPLVPPADSDPLGVMAHNHTPAADFSLRGDANRDAAVDFYNVSDGRRGGPTATSPATGTSISTTSSSPRSDTTLRCPGPRSPAPRLPAPRLV